MIIQDSIPISTSYLAPDDTAEHALGLFMELRVRHLPVVDAEGRLLGIASEEGILESAPGPDAVLAVLPCLDPIFAGPGEHLFEVTKTMVIHGLTTLPIVNRDGRHEGFVRRHDLFERFARMLSIQESGAIVELEEDIRDCSLSRLVHAIEQNDVRILSILSEGPQPETGKIHLTLKLNVKDTTRIRHVLECCGYCVVGAFGEEPMDEELCFRIEEFMRYLEA